MFVVNIQIIQVDLAGKSDGWMDGWMVNIIKQIDLVEQSIHVLAKTAHFSLGFLTQF